MVDQPVCAPSDILDTSIFTDPHFLAAARTFQDHIYSDWMSDAHREKVTKFKGGIRDGTLAAAWKDDVWYKNNKQTQPKLVENSSNTAESSARAGYVFNTILTSHPFTRRLFFQGGRRSPACHVSKEQCSTRW